MPVEPAKGAISRDPILVDLALQGGGSHGAFTWGVLDRLLEEPWLGIDGISGTSAGAMNAAVLVDGHAKGGAAGARTALAVCGKTQKLSHVLSGEGRWFWRCSSFGPFVRPWTTPRPVWGCGSDCRRSS